MWGCDFQSYVNNGTLYDTLYELMDDKEKNVEISRRQHLCLIKS